MVTILDFLLYVMRQSVSTQGGPQRFLPALFTYHSLQRWSCFPLLCLWAGHVRALTNRICEGKFYDFKSRPQNSWQILLPFSLITGNTLFQKPAAVSHREGTWKIPMVGQQPQQSSQLTETLITSHVREPSWMFHTHWAPRWPQST